MSEAISIFNIGQHSEAMNAGMFREKVESNLFDPKLKDAQDSMTFIVRPMPYVKNPLKSMVSKSFYALPDPAGAIFFDSRTSFNRPAEQHYEFCEVSDMWLKLHNAKDVNLQNLANNLRLQRANYSYVQIVKFPREPKYEGNMVVMRLPAELLKLLDKLAKPSKDELALGAEPIQPFDIMKGMNIKCTITGKMVNGTLMRDWKVETTGNACEASFPIGANGAMVPVSQAKQEDVLKFFEEQQTIDMEVQYGYKAPNNDVKLRVKSYLQRLVGDIPGLREVAAGYFPELAGQVALDQNAQAAAQPAAQPLPPTNAGPAVVTGQNPMEAAQAPAQPAAGPALP